MFSSVRSDAGKARINAAVSGFQSRPDKVQPSIPEKIASIKAGYDIRSISPQEIDQLFDALVQVGQPVSAPMLLLNSMGEQFRGRLARITGSDFDGSKPLDLLAVAQLQIHRARKQGGSSGGWELFLNFLKPSLPAPAQPAPAQPAPAAAAPAPIPQPKIAQPQIAQPQSLASVASSAAVQPQAPLGHMAKLAQQAQSRPH
jgi:hypothetical protein